MSRRRKSRSRDAGANPRARALRPQEGPAQVPTARWVRWLVPLLVALVTLVAFLPTLQNQFVAWDDDRNFSDNPQYRGLTWTHLGWMWTTFHLGHYMPLTWMTLGLDYLLWGMNPLGYHLTSLLLHAGNAVVVYLVVVGILTWARPGAAERGHGLAVSAGFAALVFAIHPLRVESVAWVTERRDVLSGLFYLLTILVYLRARPGGERGRRGYWLSVVLFGCALLSKSMAVSLPVVLLILDVYPLRRLGGAIGWWSEPARRVYVEKIPFVLLAAAAAAIAFKAQLTLNMASMVELSVPDRLAVSAYGLSFYLWKMIVPVHLSPLYELPPAVNPWARPFVLSYGVALALTVLALALRRRLPSLLAVWGAYGVVLLPVLGIFQNGLQIAADRYTYLASVGWAVLAGAGLLSCWRALMRSKTGTPMAVPLAGIALGVVVGLGVLTWNQVQVWRDSDRLWAYALVMDPNSPIAQNNFGHELARQGRLAEATEHFQQALRLKPDYALARSNLGMALAQQGKLAEAIAYFQQALRLKPDLAEAHTNWGLTLARQGKLAEAIEHFQEALRLKPDYALAHTNWGLVLTQQGKLTEAIEHFQQAVRLKPDYALAYSSWGVLLMQQGRLAEAIEHFQQALRFKPDYALAHSNWGLALIQQGKLAEAIEHFQQALRLKPDLVEAHTNWGLALAQQGKLAEAAEHYQQAQKGQKGQ